MDQTPRDATLSDSLLAAEVREAELYRHLAELHIAWQSFAHAPVFTVDEARALRGTVAGVHTKNLFLKDRKSKLWLIVLREELRLDLKELARELAAPRFSFGSTELLMKQLGVPAGSVTPFALMNDKERSVQAVLDAGMLSAEPLNFHPLRNDRTISISAADLGRFLEATGHQPIIQRMPLLAD